MAGESTAFVLVSNICSGPFQDRTWKARHGITLIEKLRPVWTSSSIGFSVGEMSYPGVISLPPGITTAEELVFIIAATVVCDDRFIEFLVTKNHGKRNNEGRFIIDLPKKGYNSWATLAPEMIQTALTSILGVVRIGIVHLAKQSLLGEEEINWLRKQGLDLDSFVISEEF